MECLDHQISSWKIEIIINSSHLTTTETYEEFIGILIKFQLKIVIKRRSLLARWIHSLFIVFQLLLVLNVMNCGRSWELPSRKFSPLSVAVNCCASVNISSSWEEREMKWNASQIQFICLFYCFRIKRSKATAKLLLDDQQWYSNKRAYLSSEWIEIA